MPWRSHISATPSTLVSVNIDARASCSKLFQLLVSGPLPDLGHDILGPKLEVIRLAGLDMDADEIPDICMFILMVATLVMVLWSRCRWIILRRWFTVHGTLMFLRSVTVVVTSVPDAHPRCR